MRLATRLACAATACLLMSAGAVTLAGSADAVAPLTVTGSVSAPTHGPGTATFSYQIVVPSAVDATVFTTHQDPTLPASASGVTLDNAPVPAGQIIAAGGDITVQTGATPADGLAAGTHVIAFTAPVGTAPAATSSTAMLSWTIGGVPDSASSAPVTLAVNQIDLRTILTPDEGEDQLGFLGTGADLEFDVDVENIGYGSPDSQLELDLPVGLALGQDGVVRDEDGSPLTCAPDPANAQHLICDLGTLTHTTFADDPTLDIDLVATPAARVGATVAITATASPKAGEGTDINPANDSATAHIKFAGSAALTYTVTPAEKKVELGASTTVKLTVHNSGPQPTGETIAFSVLIGDNFTITGFTGNTTPPADLGGPAGGAALAAAPTGVIWFAGNIAAGHSASAILTIKATKLGTTQVGLLGFSEASDPNCLDGDCDPTTASVQAIAVAAKPAAPTNPVAPDSGSQPDVLANTGAASGQELGVGALLLLSGSLLLMLGRRRRLSQRSPPAHDSGAHAMGLKCSARH
jgi:hypothetical protein